MSEVLSRFRSWANSELASHYANNCPDEVMDHLVDEAQRHVTLLATVPAQNADELLLKLFPLLLASYEPPSGAPPMALSYGAEDDGSEALFRSIVEDLRRVSPILAELMQMPDYRTHRRAA